MGTPEGVHVATVTTENGEIVHIHQGGEATAANQVAATNQSITVPSATTTSPVVAVTDTPAVVIEQAEWTGLLSNPHPDKLLFLCPSLLPVSKEKTSQIWSKEKTSQRMFKHLKTRQNRMQQQQLQQFRTLSFFSLYLLSQGRLSKGKVTKSILISVNSN